MQNAPRDPTDAAPGDRPPVAEPESSNSPQAPTGHYGPGYGDPTPVDPAQVERAAEEPELAYARWRERRLREFDEDYAAWRETGARQFPPDFDAWRSARRELIAEQSAAGLPLVSAGEDASASERAALHFERS